MRRRVLEEKWITDKDESAKGMAIILVLFILWACSG